MTNLTEGILEFSQLLYCISSDNDIDDIRNEVLQYFNRFFPYVESLFFLFEHEQIFYSETIGRELTFTDKQELSIIIKSFFPTYAEKDEDENIISEKARSTFFVPLTDKKNTYGICGLYLSEKITEEDKDELNRIILDIGDALFNAIISGRDRQELTEIKEEYQREIKTAEKIHKKIIPPSEMKFPGLEIKAFYKPFKIVGGDYYNCLPVGENKYLVVMADAAGKGMSGAMITNMFHIILRYFVMTEKAFDLYKCLENINRFMSDSIDSFHFIATLFLLVDLNENKIDICNCGSYSPIFFSENCFSLIEEGNPPMGIDLIESFEIGHFPITEGLKFCLFTDGVADEPSEFTRIASLINDFKLLSIDNIVNMVYSKINNKYCLDDITIVCGGICSGQE